MNTIETITDGTITGHIYQDEDASNPRTEWDNVGKMVCFHRRYNLGDKHEFSDPDEFREYWEEQDPDNQWVILPLYLYDHSGITIRTGPFSCPWDSGQVGWIYCTKEDIDKEWNGDRERAEKYLQGEVENYDQYLTGDVYGYVVDDEDGEQLDSCWGFYGLEYCLEEMKEQVRYFAKAANAQEMRNRVGYEALI